MSCRSRGSGPTDIWAAGDSGTLLHYDGVDWTPQTLVSPTNFTALWGAGPDDVFAVGVGAVTILHYDGQTWTPVRPRTPAAFVDVWGAATTVFFATADDRVESLIRHRY